MAEEPVLVIEAGRTERHYWADLWRYRELFWFLAWRDLLVRYKQTAIGVAWAVVRPLLTMVVFTLVFGKLAGLPSENVPYPVLVFAALLPWQLFATAFAESGQQPRQQCELDLQGLLPAPRHPGQRDAPWPRGLRDRARDPHCADGLVRARSRLADPDAAVLHAGRDCGGAVRRYLDGSAQRQVSRRALRHPVCRADGALRVSGRFSAARSFRTSGASSTR